MGASPKTAVATAKPGPPVGPRVFVFKSKYRQDKVTLDKMIIEVLPDGSKRIVGTNFAEFDHNTFSTSDPRVAANLRALIVERRNKGVPLHVYEVTDEEVKPDGGLQPQPSA